MNDETHTHNSDELGKENTKMPGSYICVHKVWWRESHEDESRGSLYSNHSF